MKRFNIGQVWHSYFFCILFYSLWFLEAATAVDGAQGLQLAPARAGHHHQVLEEQPLKDGAHHQVDWQARCKGRSKNKNATVHILYVWYL